MSDLNPLCGLVIQYDGTLFVEIPPVLILEIKNHSFVKQHDLLCNRVGLKILAADLVLLLLMYFSFIRMEDTGKFTCLAKNDAGRTTLSMKLIVHGKNFRFLPHLFRT
jgi:hypothetical protein